MSAFISGKRSLLILFSGLCVAAGVALGLNYLLAGPRLGPVYDFLLKLRPAPPVSGNILLIDTDEIVEPGEVFTVLITLSELEASDLLIEVPVLGSELVRVESDEDIRRRISDEYTVLGRNIRNLFEAIRVGSVAPQESALYVENLVELAERGRDRLRSALAPHEEAGSDMVARASEVFGSVLTAMDLRSEITAETGSEISDEAATASRWYSRPVMDSDGKFRRIAPLLIRGAEISAETPDENNHVAHIEHIVFRGLSSRREEAVMEYTESGQVLVIKRKGAEPFRFPLDNKGNILIERPRKAEGFRSLATGYFREYEEADRVMRRLLKDAEALGVYSKTLPERIPLILCDYAFSLRENLLRTPSPENCAAWIAARADYINSLDEFLYGPAEMTLVNGYEEIIATENLNSAGIAKLQNFRDEMIRAFVAMREQHRKLIELRSGLSDAVGSAFCIMGPVLSANTGASIPESSALLANALLTGRGIKPGQSRYILLFSLIAVFVILVCIHTLRPAVLLICGLAASLLCTAGFGWSFIITSYWIDPQIPAASCLLGTLVIFLTKSLIIRRSAQKFKSVYGPVVNKDCLKQLIRAGKPPLSETIIARAAIIAIKNTNQFRQEDRERPVKSALSAAEFRRSVSKVFKKAGGAILTFEGDTALICFGSPPERVYLGQKKNETQYGDDHQAH
ncbi:MAG: hypothetical protein LBH97_04055, partial [Treponema sp.]|nr:hypothetical protein [Treponema sp.]